MYCRSSMVVLAVAVVLAPAFAGSQFHFDSSTANWSLTAAENGLTNVRMGVEVDGHTLWARRSAAASGQPEAVELRLELCPRYPSPQGFRDPAPHSIPAFSPANLFAVQKRDQFQF